MFHAYYVYIITNKNRNTLYTGITSNIQRRLLQHYQDSVGSKRTFAGRYNCYYLIYVESFENIDEAILREKEIKAWRREKKDRLIEKFNPSWVFLNNDYF